MVSRPASLYRPISGGGIGFPRTVSNADTFGISLAIYGRLRENWHALQVRKAAINSREREIRQIPSSSRYWIFVAPITGWFFFFFLFFSVLGDSLHASGDTNDLFAWIVNKGQEVKKGMDRSVPDENCIIGIVLLKARKRVD